MFVCGCLKGTMGVLGVVFSVAVGMVGTSHNPFVWLQYPVITCWPCLMIWSLSLLNRARQLLPQSFPMDRRLPLQIFGRIWPVWARVDSAVDSWIVTRFVDVVLSRPSPPHPPLGLPPKPPSTYLKIPNLTAPTTDWPPATLHISPPPDTGP